MRHKYQDWEQRGLVERSIYPWCDACVKTVERARRALVEETVGTNRANRSSGELEAEAVAEGVSVIREWKSRRRAELQRGRG